MPPSESGSELNAVPVAAPIDPPWRTEGLFSPHYLTRRLPNPQSMAWPNPTEADVCFELAKRLFGQYHAALKAGSEEDCEDRWISPLLESLGFGWTNRKSIPSAANLSLPDYLLYASGELAEAAFLSGQFYTDCIGLLEAKKWTINLSREGAGSRGRSPHTQLRDYLSESQSLVWGILTNGAKWRLYCKQDRASSFFEFDLERIMVAAQAAESEAQARDYFRLFYALFRRAAFERGPNGLCVLDLVRDEAQQYKVEVERRLRDQVFDCVEILARGFLVNAENHLTPAGLPAIYENCLILLYRILFVLNAEARGLLPTRASDRASRTYTNSYGIEFVRRKLATPSETEYDDDQTFALSARLQALFTLINGKPGPPGRPDKNTELNIPRYNGGLFDPEKHLFLETMRVADSYLADALRRLAYRNDGTELVSFDYANLGERHLGSIYEGLLEHKLTITSTEDIKLINDKGERKTSGAYYTPEDWVAYIVSHTLQPLLDRIPQCDTPDSFAEAVLQLNVCDPAMGSGHFLVEAVAYLAEAVSAHSSTGPRPELGTDGEPLHDEHGDPIYTDEAKLAYWKRRLVEACIYGVDLNPLAVELAKLSLWLETVDRVPLNFLDHHLRCGNSLIGTALAVLPDYPKLNRRKKKSDGQLSLQFSADLTEAVRNAIAEISEIEGSPTDTHEAAKKKEALWRDISEHTMPRFRYTADIWLAPWFGVDVSWLDFIAMFEAPGKAQSLHLRFESGVSSLRPFHWELEFPNIFFDEKGRKKPDAGFDAIIGNPPWERIKLQENEFFGGRSREIALAPKASDRKKLIAALPKTNPELWKEYEAARDRAEQIQRFVHQSGFYPLMGRGDTNYYAVFAEKAVQLINPTGRIGILVPSGIATDDTTKVFFQQLIQKRRLSELLDFENRRKVFEDVDSRFKFSVILIAGERAPQEEVRCGFFLHEMADLSDVDRVFTLSSDDFKLFNPNTLTCPILRRRRDAELTRKIYESVPVLVKELPAGSVNPWGVQFSTMFHMTNDSGLFRTAEQLETAGFWLGKGNVYTKGDIRYLPLYEAKMIHQYDHRYASGIAGEERLINSQASQITSLQEKQDPNFTPLPRFWVPAKKVSERSSFLMGYRDIGRATDLRTCIAGIFPASGAGNTIALIHLSKSPTLKACLYASLTSFVLDYSARQKVSSTHLNFFVFEQFPVIPPEHYDEDWHGVKLADFISRRVLELCYTAYDLKGFAEDLGYDGEPFPWDEERRLHLRCQLDAMYFHLYGLTREEAGEILDTFPIVRRQDEAKYNGRFRTRDLILGYYNAYEAGDMDAHVAG